MVTTTNRPRSTPRARRWLCALFATLMLASVMTVGALAQAPAAPQNSVETDVYLDGIEILDGDCVIWRDTTFVPLRKFCNLFDGCRFVWDAKTSTATVYTDCNRLYRQRYDTHHSVGCALHLGKRALFLHR